MNKLKLVLIATICALTTIPATTAAPPDQFAGCADEDDLDYAARFIIHEVFDTQFTITVIGVDDFDPQVMIRDDEGQLIACDNDTRAANVIAVDLPSVQAGFSPQTAQLSVRFLLDEYPDDPPSDFEILITGHDGRSGEFVMLYEGASIFGADDVDALSFFITEEQVAQQMPFIFYAANLNPDEFPLSPEMSLILGTEFSITCSVSDLSDLCEGQTTSLESFFVTRDISQELVLSGNDVMLNFMPNVGGEDYRIEIRSQGALTYGPYLLMVHSGVSYPFGE